MTTDQRQRILDEQRVQQDDMKARRDRDAQEERAWHQQQEDARRGMVRAAREKAVVDAQARHQLKETHKLQKREKDIKYARFLLFALCVACLSELGVTLIHFVSLVRVA